MQDNKFADELAADMSKIMVHLTMSYPPGMVLDSLCSAIIGMVAVTQRTPANVYGALSARFRSVTAAEVEAMKQEFYGAKLGVVADKEQADGEGSSNVRVLHAGTPVGDGGEGRPCPILQGDPRRFRGRDES